MKLFFLEPGKDEAKTRISLAPQTWSGLNNEHGQYPAGMSGAHKSIVKRLK